MGDSTFRTITSVSVIVGMWVNQNHSFLRYRCIYLIPTEQPAARESPKVSPIVFFYRHKPLRHQCLPIFLRFQTSHRPLGFIRDHREDLIGKLRKTRVRTCATHGFDEPLALLGYHVRGGKDLLRRIDQEEDEDLAVTRFGGILQLEWLDLVLIQIRECDASVGFGDHIANVLHTWRVPDMHVPQLTRLGRPLREKRTYPDHKAPSCIHRHFCGGYVVRR